MRQSSKDLLVQRWSTSSLLAVACAVLVIFLLALAPAYIEIGSLDRLSVLFIYILMAAMWNALAGYGGLVSIGQQAFFGLAAYFTIRIADLGINPFLSMAVAVIVVGILSYFISLLMLKLKGGEFAIGMWVLASILHMFVNLDSLIQGETGVSLISLNDYTVTSRIVIIYWCALATMTLFLLALFIMLRSRLGSAIQAIRDNEEAAASIGVQAEKTKRALFILAALGIGAAGALWLATATTFQPKTYFSVQWTAFMIFMVLVGGIGKFEGAILGAVLFFCIETWFGSSGVWYLIGLGATAVFFSLYLPKGLWGEFEKRFDKALLPIGYHVVNAQEERENDLR